MPKKDLRAGIDIVEVSRIRKAAQRERFLKRVLTPEERTIIGNNILKIAVSFALKEATWKALPPAFQKKTYFQQIRILWDCPGCQIEIAGWKGKVNASWNYCQDVILAVVVLS
ncbi:MAG: 4'-phosphopantetheinyl transferase superfamily protein [Candidatus Omnitrophica bacterium]|nr:4'-phosphopantetheinyl transferase superfamily protein [Candidatus Omnitrophota bacterium]